MGHHLVETFGDLAFLATDEPALAALGAAGGAWWDAAAAGRMWFALAGAAAGGGGEGLEAEAADAVGLYRVLKTAALREGFELDSKAVGSLTPGDAVAVLEARRNEGGQLRLRLEGGWTSLTSRKGDTMLERRTVGEAEAAAEGKAGKQGKGEGKKEAGKDGKDGKKGAKETPKQKKEREKEEKREKKEREEREKKEKKEKEAAAKKKKKKR
jgi:hypothetical protein